MAKWYVVVGGTRSFLIYNCDSRKKAILKLMEWYIKKEKGPYAGEHIWNDIEIYPIEEEIL